MDFESIEGLSDEEVENIYGASTSEDDIYIGNCCCFPGSKFVDFGLHMWYSTFYCTEGGCGYCALQLTTQASCESWCKSHGFRLFGFDNSCYCRSSSSHSIWSSCDT